jgi:hypothetical protein
VEVERCDTPSITLLTPQLNFIDVPQGPMGMFREQALAISFEVISPSTAVTLEYSPGGAPNHPQLVAFNPSDTVGPTAANTVATAQLWVVFRTGPVGAIPTQTVTVREAGGSQQWTITIDGNSVPRKTAAAALVLDRSGSMAEDRGDGVSKHASLQQAAAIFVDVMLEGDEVSLVRYNQDAQPLQGLQQLGAGGISDINRSAAKDIIYGTALDPGGATSIGDGIVEGRGTLSGTGADVKALVVLTDGVENRSLYIDEVAPQINEHTYSIGIGTPQNTSAVALQTISGNNGGFLLITGAIDQDNRFMLQKYFLQVLAGVSNAEVVLDPDGELAPGAVHRIPFQLTEADAGADVILLTPKVDIVDFRVQTPTGLIIEPWRASAEPGMRYVAGRGVSYYRFVLPTELEPGRTNQGGTWQALLTIGRPRVKPTDGSPDGVDRSILRALRPRPTERMSRRRRLAMERAVVTHVPLAVEALDEAPNPSHRKTVPYSVIVHTYSSLSFRAQVEQSGFEPGTTAFVVATLTEAGIPLHDAAVWAEVVAPDGTRRKVELKPEGDGSFRAVVGTSMTGVYRIRARARGHSRRGRPFTRERSLTAAVWRGGDLETGPSVADVLAERDERLCRMLLCLLSGDEAQERLNALGINPGLARECIGSLCQHRPRQDELDR